MTILELKERIIIANKKYREGEPIINDDEYDELLYELEKRISNKDFQEFRKNLFENPGKFKHTYKVGSLRKIKYEEFDVSEIENIINKEVIITPKIDGNSIILYYDENGNLANVVTRGNGIYGEIRNGLKPLFPQKFLSNGIVRGELYISFDNFEKIKNHFKDYKEAKNPRNLIAGLIHRDNLNKNILKYIDFLAFEIMGSNETQQEQLDFLLLSNFNIPDYEIWRIIGMIDKETLKYTYEKWKTYLNYPIDGLVLNDIDYRFENKMIPENRIAFKVNEEIARSEIIDIEWNVSKNGKITPVAKIKPVELNGTKVEKITLFNAKNVYTSKIGIGSKILVFKSGEIIPAIKEVLTYNDPILPKECPVCGKKLKYEGTELWCKNENCPAKTIKKLVEFLKRLKIKGFTEKSLKNFGISNFKELINFKANKKYKNQVKLEKVLKEKMENLTEEEIFKSYPFQNLGDNLLSRIINYYGFENIKEKKFKSGYPELVSDITFKQFKNQLDDALRFLKLIKEKFNVKENKKENKKKEDILKGKSFCITGSFENFKRDELEKKIKELGGEIKGISKKLDYLIVGNKPGSKLEKAKKLGVKILKFDDKVILDNFILKNNGE